MILDNVFFEKNNQDFYKLSRKYFIHTKKRFLGKKTEQIKWKIYSIFTGVKKRDIAAKKLRYINKRFLSHFDQESYLRVNEDLKKSLENGQFDSPLEHFILFGYDEVREGKRRVGSVYPLFTEKEYADINPDVVQGTNEGKFSSAFEHFLLFGYEEFLSGKR